MKRIHLSKPEKRLLRCLAAQILGRPAEPTARIEITDAIRGLEAKGLAHARYEEGGDVVDARISRKGRLYVQTFPTLRNPINWPLVAQWLSVALGAAATAAALFACARAGLL